MGAICLFHLSVNYSGLTPKESWEFYWEEASRLNYCKSLVRRMESSALWGGGRHKSSLFEKKVKGSPWIKLLCKPRDSLSCTGWQVPKQRGGGPRKFTQNEQFQKWYISCIWQRGKAQIPVYFGPDSQWLHSPLATAWKGRKNGDGGFGQSFSLVIWSLLQKCLRTVFDRGVKSEGRKFW